MLFVTLLLAAATWATQISAQTCQSFGIDFVNGGSYFINQTSLDQFTFLTQFEGCVSQGSITPILVDPSEDSYFCTDIATSPDDTSFVSTCPIQKSAMVSGTWYIVIEGLTFAYVRTFTVTVGVPVTIIATPTITIGVISTPNVYTYTATNTSTFVSTLPGSTITTPCRTVSSTKTTRSPPSTVSVTKTSTRTKTTSTKTTTTSTIIKSTAVCTPPPYTKAHDPIYTGKIPVPSQKSHKQRDVVARFGAIQGRGTRGLVKGVADNTFDKRALFLFKRAPDDATTTYTQTTSNVTVTSTSALATPTTTEIVLTTVTSISTPAPTTVCSGVTKVVVTTTLPASTRTVVTQLWTTKVVIKTVTIIRTTRVRTVVPASSTACYLRGGSM